MAGECMAAGELVRLLTREHTAHSSWQVFSLGGGDTSLGGWHQVVKAPPEHMSLDECHRNHNGKGMSLKCSAENSGFTKAFERGEPKVRANLVKKPLEQPWQSGKSTFAFKCRFPIKLQSLWAHPSTCPGSSLSPSQLHLLPSDIQLLVHLLSV